MKYLLYITLLSFLQIDTASTDPEKFREAMLEKLAVTSQDKLYLKTQLQRSKDAVERSILSNQLGLEYQKSGQLDSAMILHQQALQEALLISFPNDEVATSYNKIGIIHFYRGNYDSAILYMAEATDRYLDIALKGNAYNNLALANKYAGNPEQSIAYYLNSIDIYESLGDTARHIVLLNNIGSLYFGIEVYDKAEIYSQKALNLSLLNQDLDGEMISKANLANVYKDQGDPRRSIPFYLECIRHFRNVQDYNNIIANSNNVAMAYDELGEPEKALGFYQQAINVMDSSGYQTFKTPVLINTGAAYEQTGQLDRALNYYLEAFAFTQNHDEQPNLEKAYDHLSAIYKKLGKPDSSLYFRDLQVALLDSLEKVERQKKMLELESTHQNKKLTKDLEEAGDRLLEQETKVVQRTKWFLILISMLLPVLGWFAFRNHQKKKQSSLLRKKIKVHEHQIIALNHKTKTGKLPFPEHMTELTIREKEVLIALQNGFKDQEIADQLFLSIATVRTHLRKAFAKINVRNRVEAVQFLTSHELE